ncbi:MAG: superoxide dismutase [Alphaproteobacteria bacterium]|nr:superoxide dismutase [Alphaproteobacteria bacterium]MCL2889682.1 superoxide dismutase [Alphaproteobacteria bacterium]
MAFDIENYPLPFARDGLEPYMSVRTVDFHYDRHLGTYIKNLNDLIAGTKFESMTLEEIVRESDGKIFNNAAQVFNHNFFFAKLKKDSGTKIPSHITDTFKDFNSEFKAAALGIFGSGWAWLVDDNGTLKIITTANGDTPIAHGMKPLLCLDVWEHAYYLDYQNRRGDFVDAFLNHLVNWDLI